MLVETISVTEKQAKEILLHLLLSYSFLLSLLQRTDISFWQALSSGFQDAAHDLAGTRLRKFIQELDIFRTGDRAHVCRDVLA